MMATKARPPRHVALHAEVSAEADPIATQARCVAMHAEVSAAADARRPLLVEAPPAGAMPATATTMMNVAATPLGRKGISPLTKLSASAK